MSDYTISQVDGDLEEETIKAIHRVCFPGCTPYDVDGSHWWLARDSLGAPAGFAGITVGHKEGGAYMCRAGVLPAHRGNGLQRRLIKVRERKARDMGLGFLVTDTIDNPVSANHLIDAGFRLFTPMTPWGHNRALYWRKELV